MVGPAVVANRESGSGRPVPFRHLHGAGRRPKWWRRNGLGRKQATEPVPTRGLGPTARCGSGRRTGHADTVAGSTEGPEPVGADRHDRTAFGATATTCSGEHHAIRINVAGDVFGGEHHRKSLGIKWQRTACPRLGRSCGLSRFEAPALRRRLDGGVFDGVYISAGPASCHGTPLHGRRRSGQRHVHKRVCDSPGRGTMPAATLE